MLVKPHYQLYLAIVTNKIITFSYHITAEILIFSALLQNYEVVRPAARSCYLMLLRKHILLRHVCGF